MKISIAIAIGCDVHPVGAVGIGPSKKQEKINAMFNDGVNGDERIFIFYSWVAKIAKLDIVVMEAYVMAMLYKPAAAVLDGQCAHKCMFHELSGLYTYVKKISHLGIENIGLEGPALCTCIGLYKSAD